MRKWNKIGEHKSTDINKIKPDFYLDANQNHCDNTVDDTP